MVDMDPKYLLASALASFKSLGMEAVLIAEGDPAAATRARATILKLVNNTQTLAEMLTLIGAGADAVEEKLKAEGKL